MENIAKIIMVVGFVIFIIGVLMYFGDKYLPLFRLPGDLYFDKGNIKFVFPIATSIILSVIMTIIINVFLK